MIDTSTSFTHLTPEQHEHWDTQGYLVLPGALSEAEVNRLTAAVNRLDKTSQRDGRGADEFLSTLNVIEEDDAFLDLIDHPSHLGIVMDADWGGNVQQLTDGPGWTGGPAWSPDGTRIAFMSDRDGDNDIYVMDADGGNVQQLTNAPWSDADPAWSPDGTRIAFYSNRDGDYDIYVMDADGGNVQQLTNDPERDWRPAWSPG